MTDISRFIAGDWGTSNLRLYLCEHRRNVSSEHELNAAAKATGDAHILDTRFGPGIRQISADFEDKFFNLTQDWLDAYGALPVLLSGMIGSTIGWKDAPYLTCPIDAKEIAAGRVQFEARGLQFSILAGLRTENPLGSPDVMRGEELQILGWLRLQAKTTRRKLFALPGTHNKWALVEGGNITSFLTAFTGELFALLRNNSILVTEQNTFSFNQDVFMDAVANAESMGAAQLVHTLFATRSKQVLGEMASADALSYLSGLIIGSDVIGARDLFDSSDGVIIIGDATLAQHYSLVLDHFGVTNECCDPADIAISGYQAIFQQLLLSDN